MPTVLTTRHVPQLKLDEPPALSAAFGALELRCLDATRRAPSRQLPTQAKLRVLPALFTPEGEPATMFHSCSVPSVSLASLCGALYTARTQYDESVARVAICLFLRYERMSGVLPTRLMMHRLFVACMVVAGKCLIDCSPTNKRVAVCAGVSTAELNRLELELTLALDWNLQVSAEEKDGLLHALIATPTGGLQVEAPTDATAFAPPSPTPSSSSVLSDYLPAESRQRADGSADAASSTSSRSAWTLDSIAEALGML